MRFRYSAKSNHLLLVVTFIAAISASGFVASAQQMRRASSTPPATRTDNVAEDFHDTTINDPYRWLEDQKAPETRAWIDAQNNYTDSVLGSLPGRDRIRQRLTELLRIDVIGQPTVRGGRYFFSKRSATQNQPVIYMRRGLKGQDEVLIDPNAMSADQTTTVNLMDVSEDGKLIIYGVRQGGADEVEVRFMDTDTKRDLPDRMPTARYFGMDMTPDKSGVYYTRFQLPQGSRVYYHKLGTEMASDKELFGAGYTATQIVSPSLSEDGRYLFYYVSYGSSGKTEIYYQNLTENLAIKPLATGMDARFGGQAIGDRFFMFTNYEAPNGKIVEVDLKN
nr:S9 family peptidase [Pyrinomonadaceae bacterium]